MRNGVLRRRIFFKYPASGASAQRRTLSKPTHPTTPQVMTLTWQRDGCFGCGVGNPRGLHLLFALGPDGRSYRTEFTLDKHYAGPPGHAHGGIIATILDESMGKAMKLRNRVALTRRMTVDYLKPVPLGKPLVAEGRVVRVRGRALYNRAEIRDAHGKVLARSKGVFLTIDPERMFARELLVEQKEGMAIPPGAVKVNQQDK